MYFVAFFEQYIKKRRIEVARTFNQNGKWVLLSAVELKFLFCKNFISCYIKIYIGADIKKMLIDYIHREIL